MRFQFTSESVTEGHPDKVCDRISDAVLDAALTEDPAARVACEVLATTGTIFVAGEMTTECYVDIQKVARGAVAEIGYTKEHVGFDAKTCAVLVSIDEQSPDIALGVDSSAEFRAGGDVADRVGAGDQGMMFGFACNDTPELMPAPIVYAHRLTRRLAEVRKSGLLDFILPDGKSQVTFTYKDGKIESCDAVVISSQHSDAVSLKVLRGAVLEHVIRPVMGDFITGDTDIFINPTGRFVVGGPHGDTGLTGRKIIADTYGGFARHGGGAFSGKDPTKVDRSAAYMARYIAKNVVAASMAQRCEVQLAYAIGVAQPVSVYTDTRGTGVVSDERLSELITEVFDMRPQSIIERFDLRRPIYSPLSAYGHFGRPELKLPWERIDMAEKLKIKAAL